MQETDTQTWLDKNFPESAGSNSKGRYNQSAIIKAATLDLVMPLLKMSKRKTEEIVNVKQCAFALHPLDYGVSTA